MLSRSDIKKLASNAATFQRGLGIYIQSEKFYNFKVTRNRRRPKEVKIEAQIEGSGVLVYDVELDYRTDSNEIVSAWCDCPAFETYGGLCKHCVAALLEYADYQEKYRDEEDDEGEEASLPDASPQADDMDFFRNSPGITDFFEDGVSLRPVKAPKAASSPQTTESLKHLIQKEISRRTAPVMQPEMVGTVGLYPYLEINSDGDAKVSFKIGGEKPYVLKDVFTFAQRTTDQADYAYGKKLSFIHTMEAFTPEGQNYVRFLMDWVRGYKESYTAETHYRYYYYSSLPAMRYVPLKSDALEKLLEAAGGNVLEGKVSGEKETYWTISYEKPEIQLIIRGSQEGAELYMDCPTVYNGNQYEIFFSRGIIYLVDRRDLPGFEDFIQCFAIVGKVFISKDDLPAFFAQLLPKLRQYMTINYENIEPETYAPPEASFAFYLDAPTKKAVTCRVDSLYGDERFNILDRNEAAGRRDLVAEAQVLQMVNDCFEETDSIQELFILRDEEGIYELLTSGIERLQNEGEVFVSDALKNIRVHPAPKVSVGISMSGSLLDLTLLSGGMSKEDLADILNRYDKKKKYHRLKNGDFIDIDDEGIDVLAELKESLHMTAKELLGDHILLPKYRALYLDQALKEKASLPVERDRDFRALIRNMKTTEDNDYELPAGIQAELRSYQKRGFLWMKTLAEYGFGGILADDMGLGKTLQVITYLQSEYEEKGRFQRPHLIICPASLVYNWESELQRFAPQLPVRVIAGSAAERKREIAAVENGDICITSYELLRRDVIQYENLIFGCQVIDEAQYIKNHSTQAAKAVKLIRSSFRLALTGTPVENRLSELWSIFDFLMPGFLYGYDRFRKEMEQPIVLSKDEEALDRLKKMIGPFVLRRLKSQVLRDLPDKIEKNMFTRLTGEQQKLYDADVQKLQMKLSGQSDADFNTSKIEVLAALTRLRQICCDPSILFEGYKGEAAKMELCMDLIENAAESGHKILLFSQFTTLLEQLQQRLEKAGFSYYVLTGATKKEERARLVNAFNQDDTQVFLISLKAGGTGLNLMSADVVIHFDPWWNLAVQNQATDRAHRIGQKNVVSVYKLIAKGTIEEKILELQEQKRQLADQLLSGSDMASPAFNRDELLALLEQQGPAKN